MTFQSPTPPPEPRYLAVAEVAKRLGKTTEFVQSEIDHGALSTTAIGNLIAESDVLAWEQRHPLNQWRKRVVQSTLWQKVLSIGFILSIIGIVSDIDGFWGALQNWGVLPVPTFTITPTLTATPTPTIAPTITPTPLPFSPAAAGESLILIATFNGEYSSDAPHRRIQEGIRHEIKKLSAADQLGDLNLRVEVHPQILLSGEESKPTAMALGKAFSATMVIWGEASGTLIRTNFLNLRESDFAAAEVISEESERTVRGSRPDAYAHFINNDLPNQMSFLALFAVGQSYYIDGKYKQAAYVIEQSISALNGITTMHGLADAYFRLGWIYQVPLKQTNEAINHYSSLIKLDPNYASAYMNRGNAYVAQNKWENAIADYTKLIDLDPQNAKAYYNRGLAFKGQNDLDRAIQDFDQAIEIDPNYASAFYSRGNVRKRQENLNGAIADYDHAINLKPQYVYAYVERGDSYRLQEKWDTAISDYNEAISIAPKYADAYYSRGLSRKAKDDLEGAIADFSKTIELDPNHESAYYSRGNVFREQKKWDAAISDYTQAISLDPTFVYAYVARGNSYRDQKNWDEAVKNYNIAIELNSTYAPAYYDRGRAFFLQNDPTNAIKDFNQAIDVDKRYLLKK